MSTRGSNRGQTSRAEESSRPGQAGPTEDASGEGAAGPSEQEIAAVAYERWLARGKPDGADQEDWFEAERQLRRHGHAGRLRGEAPAASRV
jgi:hypothetical protein